MINSNMVKLHIESLFQSSTDKSMLTDDCDANILNKLISR
jgi:hypothetical protein